MTSREYSLCQESGLRWTEATAYTVPADEPRDIGHRCLPRPTPCLLSGLSTYAMQAEHTSIVSQPVSAAPCMLQGTFMLCLREVMCDKVLSRSFTRETPELASGCLARASPTQICILTNASCTEVAGYYAPKDWDGPVHAKAGLMPRWSRDGRFVAFDSAHVWGTGSQMYVAGVQQMKVGWSATAPPAKQAPARSVSSKKNALTQASLPVLWGDGRDAFS